MKVFECGNCGNAAYFDNTVCVHCGMRLGYDPEQARMLALAPGSDGWRLCANAAHDACNWLVPVHEDAEFCAACRHNRTVPDLSMPDAAENWRRIEAAKRHLFYSLMRWRLPMPDRNQDPDEGLAFDFLADNQMPDGTVETVLTGHENGLITINVAEGDDAERERRRAQMGEPYRTLLGHFRHEIGHYYWDRLVRDRGNLDAFRDLFGDDREDYAASLQRHYENGPPAGWQLSYISAYATTHPWEDFAETWAHYLHIVDTLETAAAFGMTVTHPDGLEASDIFDPYRTRDVSRLLSAWVPMTVAINAVNRSMGQPDLYPFVLSDPIARKLQFVCDMVLGQSHR
ncbi:putative zinc-binding peptidase [Mesorhizobium sp. CAU 1741]|uniref:zinc-binding metallopeptidase family protein n=1 Tax=Mesorhizobium sp. CAU 1741 TaxID=3140366 RepID=UPI00325BFFD8